MTSWQSMLPHIDASQEPPFSCRMRWCASYTASVTVLRSANCSAQDSGQCRWWVLRGTALGSRVQWEETWWESSDWSGMREMGAQKVGCNVSGDAWREAWKERVYHVTGSGEPYVERSAHKWATDGEAGEEWEEKWGEFYSGSGAVNKWADKWGKRGSDVRLCCAGQHGHSTRVLRARMPRYVSSALAWEALLGVTEAVSVVGVSWVVFARGGEFWRRFGKEVCSRTVCPMG